MTHDERVYHHLYETCEGIAEQSERIASLEELVLDMNACIDGGEDCEQCTLETCQVCEFDKRIAALEIRE